MQVQTDEPDDTGNMTFSASQTDDVPISNETKKRVLLELGMSAELAEACIEFPEELCLRLQDFTDTHTCLLARINALERHRWKVTRTMAVKRGPPR